jgi:uncharacterized DUF497 family protein
VEFEWDASKAESNLEKHDLSFDEAATAFGDPLSLTIADPDHSEDEDRYVLLGESYLARLMVVVFTERARESGSSALDSQVQARGEHMKPDSSDTDMRDEYDFTDGVRGKYADRFAKGSNVVVLDPDIAAEFKTPQAVNDALRAQLRERRRAAGDDG